MKSAKEILETSLNLFRDGEGWTTGDLCRIEKGPNKPEYCSLGAVFAASGFSPEDMDGIDYRSMLTEENRAAIYALAEEFEGHPPYDDEDALRAVYENQDDMDDFSDIELTFYRAIGKLS